MENMQYRELNGFTEELRDELSAINARMIAYARNMREHQRLGVSVVCARVVCGGDAARHRMGA